MHQTTPAQRQVLSLLQELLSQLGDETPQIQLQRYQFALRTLIYACPHNAASYQTEDAYYVLVEALHQIYHRRESSPDPWVAQVADVTYDAFLRLQKL